MQEFLRIAKALGDEARLRALLALRDEELCLCQLIELLQLSPSTVSRHLSVLARAGLVEQRKEGKWRFYRLPGPLGASGSVHKALDWALWSLRGEARAIEDRRRLRSLCTRDLQELAACYRKPPTLQGDGQGKEEGTLQEQNPGSGPSPPSTKVKS